MSNSRLILMLSAFGALAACGDTGDDSSGSGDNGAADDGAADDGGNGDDGAADDGGNGDDGAADDGGNGDDGAAEGGGGTSWSGAYGLLLVDVKTGESCDIIWWTTSGVGSSLTCAGCDYTYDVEGTFHDSNCLAKDKGDDTTYSNGHVPDYYEYNGTPYDAMLYMYNGDWLFNGLVYDGGAGSGYVNYTVYTGSYDKTKAYAYVYNGYGTYN